MKKIFFRPVLACGVVALMLVSSCKKNDGIYGGDSSSKTDNSVEGKIRTIMGNMPQFKASPGSGVIKGGDDRSQGGWDFSNPGSGYNYSSPNGVNYSSNSNTFTIAASGGGPNAGGTVVAGASALDMNYTFCFAIGEQVNGLSAFGTGAPSSGVSGVIGVSGDFSKLKGSAKDFSDVFKGLAFYIVYDGKASGKYEVIDWLDPDVNLNDTTPGGSTDKKCFALVVDYKNSRFYLSTGGTINVSGGSMDFDGDYLEVSGYKIDNNGNYDLKNLSYRKVPGFGAMGCN